METKAKLIAELQGSREAMRALLRDLEAAHAEKREVYPTWTIKELLSHITGWDDACIASLQAHASGDVPATPAARGIDPYNASTVNERMALSLEQVIQEWETTRAVFLQLIHDLPDDRAAEEFVFPWGDRDTLPVMVKIFAEHEIEHADEIRQRLLS